jgi:hypothetical protein
MMMFFFWVLRREDSSVDANVSEKHTVSIFPEESIRRQTPEEDHHHHYHNNVGFVLEDKREINPDKNQSVRMSISPKILRRSTWIHCLYILVLM